MTLEAFRKKVNELRRAAGIAQKQLAREIGLNPSVLSHKLNATDGMRLTHPEVKQIIKLLAGWQAIGRRDEAIELLDMMGLKPTAFSDTDWALPPLNVLEVSIPPTRQNAPLSAASQLLVQVSVTPLIGRAELIQTICARLSDSNVRLLTLTGTGGIGKTRAAIEVMQIVQSDYKDGVVCVPLAGIRDATFVASEIAHHLHIKLLSSGKSPSEVVKAALAERHLLLVLDNFEHLLAAAPFVVELLEAASQLKILVTSRMLLNIYGEYQVRVPPLALPNLNHLETPDKLLNQPSIALFVARSQAVRHSFTLTDTNAHAVAEICVRLDGHPLALELAAARTRLFSPAALLQRLDQPLELLSGGASNTVPRLLSLREMIAWSYAMLDTAEKRLFCLISAFPAGCSLEVLEALYLPPADSSRDLLDFVTSLLDKSLIERHETSEENTRFFMLETLREYGLDVLDEADELDKVREHQAAYYLNWVETLAPSLGSEIQLETADHFELEHDNLRAVLSWMLAHQQNAFMHLAGYLANFWSIRGYISEGRRWLAQALQFPPPAGAPMYEQRCYVRALNETGSFDILEGELNQAKLRLEAALALGRHTGDEQGMASALILMGDLAWENSELALAQTYYEESITLSKRLGDLRGQATGLNNLGGVLWQRDQLADATRQYTAALNIWRKLRNKRGITQTLSNLGLVSMNQEQFEAALIYHAESLAIEREIGDERSIGITLDNMGVVALQQGNYPKAQRLHDEALMLYRRVGYTCGIALALSNRGTALLLQKQFSGALASLQEALVIQRELGDLGKIALTLENIGVTLVRMGEIEQALRYHREALALSTQLCDTQGIASSLACMAAAIAAQGDLLRAAQVWGLAFQLWNNSGIPILPLDKARFTPELKVARRVSDAVIFEDHWRLGATLNLENLRLELDMRSD